MHANDNQPAYFSQAVLDRALVMRQRLRAIARQRRRAGGEREPAPPDDGLASLEWHYRRRLLRWPRRWDDLGLFNQYGIAVVATLVLCIGTLHVLGLVIAG